MRSMSHSPDNEPEKNKLEKIGKLVALVSLTNWIVIADRVIATKKATRPTGGNSNHSKEI